MRTHGRADGHETRISVSRFCESALKPLLNRFNDRFSPYMCKRLLGSKRFMCVMNILGPNFVFVGFLFVKLTTF